MLSPSRAFVLINKQVGAPPRTPEVCGGDPCIAGTRISVKFLAGWYKLGWTPEDIAREYTHLSMAQIHAALTYYHLHKGEIEQALADDSAAFERQKTLSVATDRSADFQSAARP